MKAKKFLSVAVLAVLLVSVVGPASAKGKITVYPYLDTNYALVSVLSEEMVDFSVEIKSENGEFVYSSGKVRSSDQFNKLFDFSKLSDGKYVAVLKGSGKTFLKDEFAVSGGKLVSEVSGKVAEELAAKVWAKDDYVFVSYLNKAYDSFNMKVEDDRGNVLFESALPSDLTYSGKFDVSSLPSGTYYVSLVSGKNSSSYAINK